LDDLPDLDSAPENAATTVPAAELPSPIIPATQTNGKTQQEKTPPLGRRDNPPVSGARALAESRNQKTLLDNQKLDIDGQKLDFEKAKWADELQLKKRQLDIDERRLEIDESNSRYEIELKYKTQLEIAKLKNSS